MRLVLHIGDHFFERGTMMITLQNLSKKYVDEYVLSGVDLKIEAGKVLGLIGANGSGKSTLLKILNGDASISATGGYEGEIRIAGDPVRIRNHLEARTYGISMVHQELALLGDMSVASNIKMNNESTIASVLPKPFQYLNRRKNHQEADRALERISVQMPINEEVGNLSTNQKQFVEIARELDHRSLKLLMLDEPTSALNVQETRNLLNRIREMAEQGIAVIFVSHRLEEITEICDTITVLRDGRIVASYDRPSFDIRTLTYDMIGENVIKTHKSVKSGTRSPIFEFSFQESMEQADLSVLEGEILGITGLAGNGKENYARYVMGLNPMPGSMRFHGEKYLPKERYFGRQIGYISDDRSSVSLLAHAPVWKNMVFGATECHPEFLRFSSLRGLSPLNDKKIKEYTEKMTASLMIRTSGVNQAVRELSGGNQQKVCIARALTMQSEMLIVEEPTRGIDVFSKERILQHLLELNAVHGTTILITSGEVEELVRICDRIVVLFENRIEYIAEGEMDAEKISKAMFGQTVSEAK